MGTSLYKTVSHYLPLFSVAEEWRCFDYLSGLPDGLFSNQQSQFG
jgi:hypothetical protein